MLRVALSAVLLGLGLGLGGTTDGTSDTGVRDGVRGNVDRHSSWVLRGAERWPPPGRAGAGERDDNAERSLLFADQAERNAGGPLTGTPHDGPDIQGLSAMPDPAALICAGWTTWPCAEALAIARCESGLDPDATNGSSIGLFQIDYEAHKDKTDSREALLDPAENVRAAHLIWLDQGWWAWRWSAGCHGLVPGSLPAAGISEGGR